MELIGKTTEIRTACGNRYEGADARLNAELLECICDIFDGQPCHWMNGKTMLKCLAEDDRTINEAVDALAEFIAGHPLVNHSISCNVWEEFCNLVCKITPESCPACGWDEVVMEADYIYEGGNAIPAGLSGTCSYCGHFIEVSRAELKEEAEIEAAENRMYNN